MVWYSTDSCAKTIDISIYLMIELSANHGIWWDFSIDKSGLVNDAVGGLNSIDKKYIK